MLKNFAPKGSFETGNVALSFRIALESLIIKEVLHQSDRGTVKAIQENPYLQYFLGVEKYTSEPLFDPSMMTHFRKCLDLGLIKEINEFVIKFKKIIDEAENTSSVQETPDVPDGVLDKPADDKAGWSPPAGCLKKRPMKQFQKLRELSQPA